MWEVQCMMHDLENGNSLSSSYFFKLKDGMDFCHTNSYYVISLLFNTFNPQMSLIISTNLGNIFYEKRKDCAYIHLKNIK